MFTFPSCHFLICQISREILIDPTEFAIGTEDMPDGFSVTLCAQHASHLSRDSHACGGNPLTRVREQGERVSKLSSSLCEDIGNAKAFNLNCTLSPKSVYSNPMKKIRF